MASGSVMPPLLLLLLVDGSSQEPGPAEEEKPISLATADGLRLSFTGAALSAATIDGAPLAPSPSSGGGGGFAVRSYTAPTEAGAELLKSPLFDRPHGTWAPTGGGYQLAPANGGIVVTNEKTNASSAATQRVALAPTAGPLTLRLSGWASTDGLRSNGTCADDGACRLHDTFGLTCSVLYSDGTALGAFLH